jgi:ABC-type Zn uptake system ZnuABC Zn-binding protein ZnuA
LATTTLIVDLVHNVGEDLIDLRTMLPIGSDAHTFSPTPQDVVAVADADVVFINGLGLEEFLRELLENAGGEAPVVAVSMNIEPRKLVNNGEGEEHAHTAVGADPHVWMTPAKVIIMVHNIEQALSKLDPTNAETYAANAAAYVVQLEALDAWVKTQIESIPAENRKLVTDHETFGYYADRYGLTVVGAVIPAYSTSAEPSAQELAALQELIETQHVQAVFVGTTMNTVLAERIAADTGLKMVPLYTESLGASGSGVETYLDFIRYNTTAIVAALRPKS